MIAVMIGCDEFALQIITFTESAGRSASTHLTINEYLYSKDGTSTGIYEIRNVLSWHLLSLKSCQFDKSFDYNVK